MVIERDPEPSLRTICGEYMPHPSELPVPGWLGDEFLRFYSPFVVHELSWISITIGGREFRTSYKGYSIDRRVMIRSRVSEAAERGANIRLGEAFVGAERTSEGWRLITTKGVYGARFLIGADGYPSRVASLIDARSPSSCDDVAIAFPLEVRVEGIHPDGMRLFIDPRIAPMTYWWIIPRSEDRANVGLGVRLSRVRGFDPKKALKEVLRRLGVRGGIGRVMGRHVPVGGIVEPLAQGGAFLVGDAAGMVIPSNGGGMHTAVLAARILVEALEDEDPVMRYAEMVSKWIRPMVDTGLVHRRAADLLMKLGLTDSFLVKLIPEGAVREVIRFERSTFYPLLFLLSLLYPAVRDRVGTHPRC